MFQFSRLVLATAILISFISTATAEVVKLSQRQFENLIEEIPDEQVRGVADTLYKEGRYYSLKNTLITYLDDYLDNNQNEDLDVVARERNILVESIHNFLVDKLHNVAFEDEENPYEDEDEGEGDETEDKDELEKSEGRFEDEENPYEDEDKGDEPEDEDEPEEPGIEFENEDESEEPSEDKDEGDEPEDKYKLSEIGDLFDLIKTIPDESVKSEALELLMNKEFGELNYKLMKYVDRYIETLPTDKKEKLVGKKDEIKNKIDKFIGNLQAFEDEEESEDSEDEEEPEDSEDEDELEESNDEEKLTEYFDIVMSKIKEENMKIKKLLSDLEDKH